MGRDLFTRVWIGARVSISIAIVATIIDVVVGCLYGGIAAYVGEKIDINIITINISNDPIATGFFFNLLQASFQ